MNRRDAEGAEEAQSEEERKADPCLPGRRASRPPKSGGVRDDRARGVARSGGDERLIRLSFPNEASALLLAFPFLGGFRRFLALNSELSTLDFCASIARTPHFVIRSCTAEWSTANLSLSEY